MGRARQGATTTTTSQPMSSDQLESVCYDEHDGASVSVCRHENSEDITHNIYAFGDIEM